ncbi:hypothetical protein F5X68DRAFT_237607 [Plectosphaerella plurivora]|uniref:Uncharacterized protein n=1 Tax=Plectosphaerella plurivora TaxID=936078 RepID=A0A9P9A566_9PEZI|nr:hypothetical protein F5X68DRAFT_237607 [Plectosphaerella plurivora]
MCVFASGVYAVNSVILVNTIAAISPIYTPYLWPSSDAPRYTTAMASSAAFSAASAILAWVMRWMLIKENRRIRRSNDESTIFYAY